MRLPTKKERNELERLEAFFHTQAIKREDEENRRLRKEFKTKSGQWVYSLAEISVILHRSLKCLRQDVQKGKLSVAKVGSRYLCTRRDVLAYLEANRFMPKGRVKAEDENRG
jgi:hypothetical protein